MANILVCDACKFLFTRVEKPDLCPDCGKEAVREANIAEQEEFRKLEAEREKWAK